VLSKGNWRVDTFVHLELDFLAIDFGSQEGGLIRLNVSLIEYILEVVFLSVSWAPSFDSNKVVIEDILTVDITQVSISLVSYTTTIISIRN
jgi:hypothetical protein